MANLLYVIIVALFWGLSIFVLGLLTWALIDKKQKLHPLFSFGFGITSLVVVFSVFCSVWKYSFGSLLFIHGLMILILAVVNFLCLRRGLKKWSYVLENYNLFFYLIKQIKLRYFLLIVLVILVVLAPAFVLRIPMSTDAQGFGVLAAAVKNGGTVDSLSPFRPEVKYVYSPGFFIFSAYTSELFDMPLHLVLLILGHFFVVLFFINLFLIGNEIRNKEFGIFMVVTGLITLGLFKSMLSGHYPRLLALGLFALFTALYIRVLKERGGLDIISSGVVLGAIALVNPTILTHVVMVIAFFAFGMILLRFRKVKMNIKDFLIYFFLVPIIGIVVSLPWFIKVGPLLGSSELTGHVAEIFYNMWAPSVGNIAYLTVYQGFLVPVLALGGIYYAIKNWNKTNLLFIMWIVAVIDVSLFGISLMIDRFLHINISRYVLPLGFAWAASIIPLVYFSALFLYDSGFFSKLKVIIKKRSVVLLSILVILVIFFIANFSMLDRFAQKYPFLYGEFASPADIEAYEWIKANTPKDALIFNYIQQDLSEENLLFNYGNFESRWVTAIAEREAVHMPTQPSFINKQFNFERLMEGQKVYLKPLSEEYASFVKEYGVDYVVIPHFLVDRSDYYEQAYRWKKTKNNDVFVKEEYDQVEFLEEVYNKGNVIVYGVLKE